MRAGGRLYQTNATRAAVSDAAIKRAGPGVRTAKPTAAAAPTPPASMSRPSSKLKPLIRTTLAAMTSGTPIQPGRWTGWVAAMRAPTPSWAPSRSGAGRSNRSSPTPTARAAASGISTIGRPTHAPTATPENTATPPRYGTGVSWVFRAPGRSKMSQRRATTMHTGTNAAVTTRAAVATMRTSTVTTLCRESATA